jgi:hypothetical protein
MWLEQNVDFYSHVQTEAFVIKYQCRLVTDFLQVFN